MSNTPNHRFRLLSKFSILLILSVFLWNFSRGVTPTSRPQTQVIEVVARQLPENGTGIPVELVCGFATLSAPNIIHTFSCKLRNNLNRRISAADVIYTIQYEEEGSSKTTSYNSTIDTKLHPDFSDAAKMIGQGKESTSVGPPGQVYLGSAAIIKGIEVTIDFVEFEDNGVLGPNREGSSLINGMRVGAKKYRTWLKGEYERTKKSVDAVLPSLEDEGNIPTGVQTINSYEDLGARAYRSRLKKMNRTKGKSEVEKILTNNGL